MPYFLDRDFAFEGEALPHLESCPLVAHRCAAKPTYEETDYDRLFEQCSEESRDFRLV
jgi:hypothetical protein